jgi:hypothetical protein
MAILDPPVGGSPIENEAGNPHVNYSFKPTSGRREI